MRSEPALSFLSSDDGTLRRVSTSHLFPPVTLGVSLQFLMLSPEVINNF